MGVRSALARLAVRSAHILVVEAPGGWRIRAEVERAAVERGWSLALSPGEADVLAVCGALGPDLGHAVAEVWEQLPGPRVRIQFSDVDDVSSLLGEARDQLLDTDRHLRDARERPMVMGRLDEGGDGMDMGDEETMNMNSHDDMDMGDGEAMDMDGGMDMEMAPSGIPLAEGAEDRDGLEMDVLHVRLGIALLYWPAGLVLRCTLQGDVIVAATAEVPALKEEGDQYRAARHVDNVVSVLALAGWEEAASDARTVRDDLLGDRTEKAVRRLTRLQGRVQHSRLLRWSLRNILPLGADDLQRLGIPSRFSGDTHDRLLAMIQRAVHLLDGDAAPETERPSAELVAQLVVGLDLATARLMVASLDIDTLASGERSEESHAH